MRARPQAARVLPERVTVAVVRRPHGVRGDLLVEVLTDVRRRLAAGSAVEVATPDGGRRPTRVTAAKSHPLGAIVRLAGVDDRTAAAALRGATLEVPRASVPPAAAGSYYYFELLDCACRDRREGELGRVVEIVEDGGGLLLRIAGGGREVLVPFVEDYLRSVDVAAGRLELDLPEGLLEACASPS